ncbi:MAG: hypothetical protein KC619_21105, partial [Myxococcales bacterium]|nr:hypothetical protein [Myxococcales bacterium]
VERAAPRDDGVASVVVPPLALPPIEPTWPSIYENLLGARGCGRVVCHGGGDERAGLVVSADRAETLRALMSDATGDDCGGAARLVVPGDPAASLFLDKLGSTPSCGDPMPLGGIPLRQGDIEAVRAWIACGAPEGDEGCPP